jgi:hypothetical protein
MSVLEDECNFNNTRQPSCHKRISKHGMGHGADWQTLRVSGHGPSGHEDDETGNEVALRVAIAVAAQPHAGQTSAPPNDAHSGVLPVVLDPCGTPAMLSKGVDAAPKSDDGAVVELLSPAGAAKPHLANEEQKGEDDAVSDESAAHDEVRGALADVFSLAESQSSDGAKDDLCPGEQRHGLSDDGVHGPDQRPNPAVDASCPVSLEVKTEHNLADEQELQDVRELAVYVVACELPSAMRVAQEEAYKGERGAENLGGNVPSRLGDLFRARSERKEKILEKERESERGMLTPRTMPIGNMTPYASIWIMM